MVPPSQRRLADALGLAVIGLVLLDLLHPSLLLLPTITAGGDTPCHYPTLAWLYARLLPALRLHGWYPGAYLGQPLLLYYFPLPFLVMSALAPMAGLPVAFKLGTVLGVFLLPPLVYASFRLMRLPFPAPLLGAAAALLFLFVEENPIWGGTIASTLTGEFSYTYGVGLALLFLGVLFRAWQRDSGPWAPAVVLAVTAYAHGYAVLWAGLTATGFLAFARRPGRMLGWLLAVAGLAFAFAAPLLVPLLAGWGWTTPYDDAWITVSTTGLLPPLLRLPFLIAAVGLGVTLWPWRKGCADRRLLLLGVGTLVGAALAAAGPALGVIDVRFVPFAQLSFALAGAATLGLFLARLARADLAALGLVFIAVFGADASSHVLRSWVDWNYSGLEAKELWPAWRALCAHLRGGVGDPRVAVEYGPVHERAGSIRMYETLPFFSGRSTLEGVYNQASVMTHPVYYLASELYARSPNPFRSRVYSRFDPETALRRLDLFNVSEVVAVSPELQAALDGRKDVTLEARIPPYALYRLKEPGPGYVEPLAFEPVRASPQGWRDTAYHWLTRKPPNRALLVFTEDRRFGLALPDPWAPPPERPLAGGVQVRTTVTAEEVRITTSRPGHPLLVKISYHPRWQAEGAFGPYLVSPGLMLLVPRQPEVRLHYVARTASDLFGLALFAVAGGLGFFIAGRTWRARSRRAGPAGRFTESADGGSRHDVGRETRSEETLASEGSLARVARVPLRVLPLLILAVLSSARLVPSRRPPGDVARLDDQAARAFAEGRWEGAAEYARAALGLLSPGDSRRGELLCVRGEALLRAGHPRLAAEAFGTVVEQMPGDPHRAQALYLGGVAREASGNGAGAAEWRRWLLEELPQNPWAERLRAEKRGGASLPPVTGITQTEAAPS
jgi:6-pyruvoyl-tetrahydropterin synthase related domain